MFNAKFKSLLCPGEKVTEEQLDTDRRILALEGSVERLSRRKFMGGGLSGAIALTVGAGFMERSAFAQTTAPSIVDVLNFALNLEYLEANLYYFVSTGNPIPASYSGTPTGAATLPPTALFTAVQADPASKLLAGALAQDELNHINDLRNAITSLGGTPIAQPALNYAAHGPVTTVAQFLATARQFTAVGNSAYAGAAQYLVSNPGVLTTAGQILGAEGQHLGAVNYLCIQENVATAFSNYTGTPSPYVDEQDQPPNPQLYFTVALPGNAANNPGGLPPARTTQEVLGIVYGISPPTTIMPTSGTTSGGFFPSGVNGSNPALETT